MNLAAKNLFLLFIGITFAVTAGATAHAKETMEFTVSDCRKIDYAPRDPQIEWKSDSELLVEQEAMLNCASSVSQGRYELEDSKLTLIYDVVYYSPQEGAFAKCVCPRRLSYRFSDLPKKDYQVEVKQGEMKWQKRD